jgi:hypothetical protein
LKRRKALLIVTAIAEVGTGLFLLFVPEIVTSLLLGIASTSLEATLVGRVAGAALATIGLASWLARNDRCCDSQHGLMVSLLIYDVLAASLLAWSGSVLKMAGVALWPAVLIHIALGVWCAVDLRRNSVAELR